MSEVDYLPPSQGLGIWLQEMGEAVDERDTGKSSRLANNRIWIKIIKVAVQGLRVAVQGLRVAVQGL